MAKQVVVPATKKVAVPDRNAKLEALRAKLATVKVGGANKRGWFSPAEGSNVVRLLPPVGDMEFFYQQVGRHWVAEKQAMYCPKVTSEGVLECPICDLIEQLDRAKDPASKEFARTLWPQTQFWMNLIDRADEAAGPKIYSAGPMVFNGITALIYDPDYGDFYHPHDGLDITIIKKKTGKKNTDVDYKVNPKRSSSPIHTDDEVVEDWLSNAANLQWVELSDDPEEDKTISDGRAVYVLPYDRLADEFNKLGEEDGEDSEDEIETKFQRPPARQPVSPAKADVTNRLQRRGK